MKATTIKIEDPLLNKLKKVMPKDTSISAFVREVLENDIRRRGMIEAAERYVEFLESNREEQFDLQEWESSDLESQSHKKGKPS